MFGTHATDCRLAGAVSALCLVAAALVALPGTPARPSALTTAPSRFQPVCPPSRQPGTMECLALLSATATPSAHPDAVAPDVFDPADLQAAYGLESAASSRGGGETLAVVDAYNDPDATKDLAAYRSQWGLRPCDPVSGRGCVTIVNEHGRTGPLPSTDPSGDWELEEANDLEMASAICPNCHLLLVEGDAATASSLATAEDTAVRLGARFVSNSFGGGDEPGYSQFDASFDHPGVAITVAAGDYGYGTAFPASSQYVTSVGGTRLLRAPGTGRGWTEQAWSDTGGGCGMNPVSDAKPSWQAIDTGCTARADNDVAAVADPATPVWVYDTYPLSGSVPDWEPIGGTSVAAPIVAAVYALAGDPTPGTYPASYLYEPGHAADLFPVTSGSNGLCAPEDLCNAAHDVAGTTYNGPTGWGTPDGTSAFTNTMSGNVVTLTDPGTQDKPLGSEVRLQLRALDSVAAESLSYSASGLPAGLSLDRSTGVISGRLLGGPGERTVSLTASDDTGARSRISFDFVSFAALRSGRVATAGHIRHWTRPGGRAQCLEHPQGSAEATVVRVWTCNHRKGEWWRYVPSGEPDASAIVMNQGRCLNIGPAHRIELSRCTGAGSEVWSLSYGAAWLYNPTSGLCLFAPSPAIGSRLIAGQCSPGGFKNFFTLPSGPIVDAVTGNCLADPGDSSRAGTAVGTERCDGAAGESWTTFSNPDDSDVNGLCMAVKAVLKRAGNSISISVLPGTAVTLQSCRHNRLDEIEGGWFPMPDGEIWSSDFGLCLTTSGNRLVAGECSASAEQLWSVS